MDVSNDILDPNPRKEQGLHLVEIQRHLPHSDRISYEDLDWEDARRAGLSADEIFVLTYFSDIESQTIMYMRDILNTQGVLDPEVMSFLTIWNYEEFFHGQALARLLEECGHSLGRDRIAQVRRHSLISETLKPLGALLFSKIFPRDFIALYMAWGALNELTTLKGYEAIEQHTRNPVLAELCRRIAKQERRHFAWYYNNARDRLAASPRARAFARRILRHVWSPVGAGVKKERDVIRLYNLVFPGRRGASVAQEIDRAIGNLPGLAGLPLMARFARKALPQSPQLETSHTHVTLT
jgi:rubrerythrin